MSLLHNILFLQLKHLIINLDPDDEGNEDAGTPKVSKNILSTPSNHVGSTLTQIPSTPNHNDVSNVSYESPEYQKQVIKIIYIKLKFLTFDKSIDLNSILFSVHYQSTKNLLPCIGVGGGVGAISKCFYISNVKIFYS